jgi:hypothetical protein
MTQTRPRSYTLCFEAHIQTSERREKEKGGDMHTPLRHYKKKETCKWVNGVVERASFFIQPKW